MLDDLWGWGDIILDDLWGRRAERNNSDDAIYTSSLVDGDKAESANSVSFSIKNNSLSAKKLRIADNILDFNPLKTRYVGFEPDTKVYLIRGGNEEDEYLFTITERDEGKLFRISK